jgi:hypothetical protein
LRKYEKGKIIAAQTRVKKFLTNGSLDSLFSKKIAV